MPVQNKEKCQSNATGPYEQTLFLGCSVLSFSASAGWNGQASELTVELAQDPCEAPASSPKYLWTSQTVRPDLPGYNSAGIEILRDTDSLDYRTTTQADPGIVFTAQDVIPEGKQLGDFKPNIGAPAYFRVKEFEFSGLIQSMTQKESAGGNPTYTVKLIDPRPILDHAQLILDSYQGGHTDLLNLFNIYAFLESRTTYDSAGNLYGGGAQSSLAAGTTSGFGAPAGGFGGSRRNDRGIPWNLIKQALQDLAGTTSLANVKKWSAGSLFYVGGSGHGYGEIGNGVPITTVNVQSTDGIALFALDLDEVPFAANDNYRISGSVMSISDLLNQVCADAGMDYYIELLPTNSTQGAILVIKVRTVSRYNKPSFTQIRNFINDKSSDDGVVSNSYGRELRAEVNSTFLIGGKVKSYYQGNIASDYITPYWGLDADGNYIYSVRIPEDTYLDIESDETVDDYTWVIRIDLRQMPREYGNVLRVLGPDHLNKIQTGHYIWVYEEELRVALTDKDSFIRLLGLSFRHSALSDLIQNIYLFGGFGGLVAKDVDALDLRMAGQIIPENRFLGTPEDLDAIVAALYDYLHNYANTFYGKAFVVTIPSISTTTDTETGEIQHSDIPSPDGAWPAVWSEDLTSPAVLTTAGTWVDATNLSPEGRMYILGNLPNPSVQMDVFKQDNGLVTPILKYSGPSFIKSATSVIDTSLVAVQNSMFGGITDTRASIARQINNDPLTGKTRYVQDFFLEASIDEKIYRGTPYLDAPLAAKLGYSVILTTEEGSFAAPKKDQLNQARMPAMGLRNAYANSAIRRDIVDKKLTSVAGWSSVLQFLPSKMIMPDAFGIPFESNTRTYGPWYEVGGSQNTAIGYDVANPGGVSCEIDDGLVPWEYGGIAYMNFAGVQKVKDSSTKVQENERGEVTVPGYPTRSLGGILATSDTATINLYKYADREMRGGLISHYGNGNVDYSVVANIVPGGYLPYRNGFSSSQARLGANLAVSPGGANITNINVTVAPQGVTTAYTISTYTPMFGRFAKVNADRLKQIGTNRLSAERSMRSRILGAAKRLVEKRGGLARWQHSVGGKDPREEASAAIAFAGQLGEDPTRKIVAAPTYHTLGNFSAYNSSSIMTMDGFFRPVSTTGGSITGADGRIIEGATKLASGLPRVNTQASSGTSDSYSLSGYTQSIGPAPPLNEYTGLPIRQRYLDFLSDPTYNTGVFRDWRTAGSIKGHDVEGVARKDMAWLTGNLPKTGVSLLIKSTGVSAGVVTNFYSDDYRFMALRGPLVIHGWGYDINGKPIPNSGDVGCRTGNFNTSSLNLTNKFKANWLEDARDWPVGPVDLRFDRQRGVWTTPPAYRMYQVQASSDVTAGSEGTFSVTKSTGDFSDMEGSLISSPTIRVENWTDSTVVAGTKNLAYYDTAESKYWLVGGGGGGGVVEPAISRSGSAALWVQGTHSWRDGYIDVYMLKTPAEFSASTVYYSGEQVIRKSGDAFAASTAYAAGTYVNFTGDGPDCPSRTYKAKVTISAGVGAFNPAQWAKLGDPDGRIRYTHTGLYTEPIGPGPFSLLSGWQEQTGLRYMDTDCLVRWTHGMTTAPVQGHYCEGGAGTNILVWYDCNVLPGWETIS